MVQKLLVYAIYPCMYSINLPVPNIIPRITYIIEKIIDKVRKFQAENQVTNILTIKNERFSDFIYYFLLNSDISV